MQSHALIGFIFQVSLNYSWFPNWQRSEWQMPWTNQLSPSLDSLPKQLGMAQRCWLAVPSTHVLRSTEMVRHEAGRLQRVPGYEWRSWVVAGMCSLVRPSLRDTSETITPLRISVVVTRTGFKNTCLQGWKRPIALGARTRLCNGLQHISESQTSLVDALCDPCLISQCCRKLEFIFITFIWLVVTGTWLLFSHIFGIIIPID